MLHYKPYQSKANISEVLSLHCKSYECKDNISLIVSFDCKYIQCKANNQQNCCVIESVSYDNNIDAILSPKISNIGLLPEKYLEYK